ncbi:hypothetical protein TSUD_37830 [Trifolium subterraneum]|uniref:Purple acid phosphatase Fn3-like domain-containing protein n=1 Tax=Trifolium subterraneum TaxID=3900 RepID=A0A2Z6LIM5_TRISU|nr:hypothetical protein TSUD_37830 [Trifolium subterraneum]
MKPTSLTILSLLLFAFTTYFPLAFTEQVKDTNGNPILADVKYFIWPNSFSTGGGLRIGDTRESWQSDECPSTVLQDFSQNDDHGLPIKFTILETSNSGNSFPLPWVAIGDSNWNKRIMEGFFKIQKHSTGYKLVFCSTDPFAPEDSCFDVGRYRDEKGNRLVLTENNDPFNLVFIADNSRSGRSVV